MVNTINTLKKKYDINAPKLKGFDIDARIKLVQDDALVGIELIYTYKATGAKLFFVAETAYKDGEAYCTFHANRSLNQVEVLRALHSEAWQKNLLEHDSKMYLGSEGSVVVPLGDSGDEEEFVALFHRVLPLIKSVLKTINPVWRDITEDAELSTKVSSVVVLDRVVDKYKKLLQEEFNN